MKPPPKWTISEWADHRRKLSSESSAEPGQWRTARAEYQREIMDCAGDPRIARVVVMSSAQVGKTEIINNSVGYFVDFDPSPMMVVQPTIEMGEAWSKDRLAPMLRDSPTLRGKVKNPRSRDSGNTTLHKKFPGGHITISGANSPASLASRPIRVVLLDEVDRYPASAGTEGDPVRLAIKRTNNFWNRRVILVSTPTVKGFSRIEKEWEQSDKRQFHVPCPHCEHEHILRWGNVVWGEKTPAAGDPTKAVLQCPECSGYISTSQKNVAVSKGRWIATAPFTGIAGFHLNELYSPWKTIAEIVADFISAKGDPEQLKTWVNTSLGETWEDGGESVTEHELLERCEPFPEGVDVPARGLVLTAGIDTQPDRLEVEVVAWAGGEESWSIDHRVIYGDPDIPEGTLGSPWNDVTDYIRKTWRHESGASMIIEATCIDTGGSNTTSVYDYVKRHRGERVFGVKGQGGEGIPIVGNPTRKRSGKKTKRPIDLYMVGVDQAKGIIMRRLKIEQPGPGYCHFPAGRSLDYFRQLTAEKMVTRYVKGFPKREWKKPDKARNEALDCRVYALAALILRAPQFDKIAYRLKVKAAEMKVKPAPVQEPEPEATQEIAAQDPTPPAADTPTKTKRRPPRRRGGFVNAWRL